MRWLATASVAGVVATSLAALPAWGHVFPPVRTVVLQVEPCHLSLLVGYRAGNGAAEENLLARAATGPKSMGLARLRDALTGFAMAPLHVAVDGHALAPTAVHAKLGVEADGGRPMVVVLVTYALPAGGSLSVTTSDARSTRISWTDRSGGRVTIPDAPAQGVWFAGVASFLLSLAAGDSTCASPTPSR